MRLLFLYTWNINCIMRQQTLQLCQNWYVSQWWRASLWAIFITSWITYQPFLNYTAQFYIWIESRSTIKSVASFQRIDYQTPAITTTPELSICNQEYVPGPGIDVSDSFQPRLLLCFKLFTVGHPKFFKLVAWRAQSTAAILLISCPKNASNESSSTSLLDKTRRLVERQVRAVWNEIGENKRVFRNKWLVIGSNMLDDSGNEFTILCVEH